MEDLFGDADDISSGSDSDAEAKKSGEGDEKEDGEKVSWLRKRRNCGL